MPGSPFVVVVVGVGVDPSVENGRALRSFFFFFQDREEREKRQSKQRREQKGRPNSKNKRGKRRRGEMRKEGEETNHWEPFQDRVGCHSQSFLPFQGCGCLPLHTAPRSRCSQGPFCFVVCCCFQSHRKAQRVFEDEQERSGKERRRKKEGDKYGSIFNVLVDETADHVDLFVADALVVVEPQDDLEGVAMKVVAFDPQFELASFGKVLAVGVWTQSGEIHIKGIDL